MKIEILVRDTPRPGGSKTAGFNHKTGKGFVRPSNPNTKTWRDAVRSMAFEQYQGKPLLLPLKVTYEFVFKRPQSHYSQSKEIKLKSSAPMYHMKKPDVTKLMRSTEDALTGITWGDDCIIVDAHPRKRYAVGDEMEGCHITIESVENND